jgi:hypothetical protein
MDSLGDSSTDSSWSDGQGPILQAYPFCESSTPAKKKKKTENYLKKHAPYTFIIAPTIYINTY